MYRKLSALGLFTLTLMLLAAAFAPAEAQRGGGRPTLPPVQQGDPAHTLTSPDTAGVQATASAIAAGAGGSAQATLDAALTAAASSSAGIQATLAALSTQASGSISAGAGSVTVTYTVSEAQVNAAINTVLAAGGYPGATANLIPGGVIVTIPNFTYEGFTGTLSVTLAVSASANHVSVSIVSVSLNGRAIPVSAVDSVVNMIESALQGAVGASLGTLAVSYSIDALVITETEMTATVTVLYAVGAQPTMIPTLPAPRPPRRGG